MTRTHSEEGNWSFEPDTLRNIMLVSGRRVTQATKQRPGNLMHSSLTTSVAEKINDPTYTYT